MSVYKDEKKTKNIYYVSCRYTDYTGENKQKVKRGFATMKEAKEWERKFLETKANQPTILFSSLTAAYTEHMKLSVKPSTYGTNYYILKKYILPYFKHKRICDITPIDIRQWQFTIKALNISNTYTLLIETKLKSILNYAVKYYNLNKNPFGVVDKIGSNKARPKKFFTLEEYKLFIKNVNKEKYIQLYTIYELLFYTGLRIGELLALTFEDIDLDKKTLNVNKTLYRVLNQGVSIQAPKTEKSNRIITLSDNIVDDLKEYYKHIYDKGNNIRLFNRSSVHIQDHLRALCKELSLPDITLHSFRHSHTALLVEMGFNPLLIAERLGHSDIKMTLNTYAHLYPNKQIELADKLSKL